MLLERLKADTAERHDRLERELDLMRPDLTLPAWKQLVERFYGFYGPWEGEIARTTAGGELARLVAERRKVAWLEQDLADLGVSAADRAALPWCGRLPAVDTTARVLGSMYV